VNSPSNPTGQIFTKDTINIITQFCVNHDITLISDEIYSDIVFFGEQEASPCYGGRLESGKIIMTGGLSKVRKDSELNTVSI
jgi:aspartate aminotransferase